MKRLLPLILFAFPFLAAAQRNYTEAIQQGDAAFAKGEYKTAINKFFAAEAFDPSKKEAVKGKVNAVFDRIEGLRKEAEAAKKRADQKTTEALEEKERADKALKDIREKNRVSFEAFASLGARLIFTLDHAEALEKMKAAVDIEVETDLKRKQLTEPLCELLYFFAESGRRPELARTAAELLLKLEPNQELVPMLKRSLQENWTTRKQFAPLLEKLPSFQKFQARYYPEFIPVPLGADSTFEMGSDTTEWKRFSDEQKHQVKLSAYQIATTPVTFYQFALFSEANDLSMASRTPYWGRFGDHPIVNVNWYQAIEYANWLNIHKGWSATYQIKKEPKSDPDNQVRNDYLKWKISPDSNFKGCVLPTEAQWELAARAGIGAPKMLYAGSDSLEIVGWYWENSGDKPLSGNWDTNRILDNNGRTRPVKGKKANEIGIYDMSGNVYEWCWDWYGERYYDECSKHGIVQDPTGPQGGAEGRVVRGGSWNGNPDICRVANRDFRGPDYRTFSVGFRLAFIP